MKTLKILIISFICATVLIEKARGDETSKGELIIQLGGFLQEVDENQSPLRGSDKGLSILSGGLVGIQAGAFSWMSVEAQIQYGQFQYLRRTPSKSILTEKVDRIQVPIIFRFWLASWFSVAAGPYASYRVGTVNGVNLAVDNEDRTSAHDTGEHGVLGDISFSFPLDFYETNFVLSYRRIYSLTPRSLESREWNKIIFAIERELPKF